MQDIISMNVDNIRPVITIVDRLDKYENCTQCRSKLSDFCTIELKQYRGSEQITERINSKFCSDCDILYVSNKVPERIIDNIRNKFGDEVYIQKETKQPPQRPKKRYTYESRTVQRTSTKNNKTMVQTRRAKSRRNTM